MLTRRRLPALAAGLGLSALPAPSLARPALARSSAARLPRSLRLVVAFPPGGGVDRVARLIQPRLAEFLGQTVVVENRGGGAGTIALNAAAAAPADGHTLLIDDVSFLIAPLLAQVGAAAYPAAFNPVGALAEMPVVLAASRRSGIGSLAAYLDAARQATRPLPYGTPGIGSIGHVAGALLARRTGLRFQHVPYRGSADVVRDLAGGRLASGYISATALLPLAEAQQAVPLAISGGGWEGLPADLPSFGAPGPEEGPGNGLANWVAAFVAEDTPRDRRLTLEAGLAHAASDAEVVRILAAFGARPVTGGVAGFRKRLLREERLFRQLAEEAGLAA